MNKRIQYSDEPIGEIKLVSDFLPSPEELALKKEQTKVTISLSSESVAFFKEVAEKHHTQYQRMIRQLLDEYVAHQKALTSNPADAVNGAADLGVGCLESVGFLLWVGWKRKACKYKPPPLILRWEIQGSSHSSFDCSHRTMSKNRATTMGQYFERKEWKSNAS